MWRENMENLFHNDNHMEKEKKNIVNGDATECYGWFLVQLIVT